MSKIRFLAGHNVRWKPPRIRIMLKVRDLLPDHWTATELELISSLGIHRSPNESMPLFTPVNDPYPDGIRAMMRHDQPITELYSHMYSTREPWEPRIGDLMHLKDRTGRRLPWLWTVSHRLRTDDASDGVWIMIDRSGIMSAGVPDG